MIDERDRLTPAARRLSTRASRSSALWGDVAGERVHTEPREGALLACRRGDRRAWPSMVDGGHDRPGLSFGIQHSTTMVTSPSSTRSIIIDGVFTTAMNAFLVGPFLAAFAFALGATHWEIGLISSIAFLSMPMQLVGLYAVNRWKQRRALIVACALSARLLWMPIVFLPFVR